MFMAAEKKACVKRELYKTELCRHYIQREQCPYKDKCQFAHGSEEIVDIIRHPKYKTELCKGYHSTGFCPYGPRCHFIHGDPEDISRTSLAIRPKGRNKRQRSTSTKSGHGEEIQESADDWQNEDQEMPTDWMNKDHDLRYGWVTPLQEAADDCLEGQGQEMPVAWPNHVQESVKDWPNSTLKEQQPADWANHVQQMPEWMQGQCKKSYASMSCNENWINQFGDIDDCRYLLMRQNLLTFQSNSLSSLSESQENCNYILPSQSFPVLAVSPDLELSKPTGPSGLPNQISPVVKNKNWNQSYLTQNSIPNTPFDVESFDWHHQTSASPSFPLNLSPILDMFNCELAFSSQDLNSNVSTVFEIFSHNLAANSQSCISSKQTGPVFGIPNRKLIIS